MWCECGVVGDQYNSPISIFVAVSQFVSTFERGPTQTLYSPLPQTTTIQTTTIYHVVYHSGRPTGCVREYRSCCLNSYKGVLAAPRHSAPAAPRRRLLRSLSHTDGQAAGGGAAAATVDASTKLRIMLRTRWFGMSALLSSVAPVFGEVSLVRSHSVMASRS